MNDVIKVLLIIILFLIVAALSLFMIFVINGKFNFGLFGFGESTTLVEEKEFEDETIKDIIVKAKTSNVYIKHSTNGKYKAEIYSDNDLDHSIKLDDNKDLIVELEENKRFFMTKTPKIVLYVPSEFENEFNIETKTGDIEAESYEKANFNIKVTTGDVNLGKTNNVKVEGTTGDIEINSVNDIYIKTTTGDIKISDVLKHLDLTTTTGDIRIDSINLTENSNINATTGDIRIDKKNDVYVDGSAKTGDVKVNDNNRHSEIELTIKTTTGDIKVG